MKKLVWLAGLCLLMGCAGNSVQTGSTVNPDEELRSLEAFAAEMLASVAKGDFSRVKASACPEAVVYDMGDDGKPVVARGKAEVFELLDGYQKMMTESGATTTSSVTALQCRVDAGPGYCLIELDQTMTVGGQVVGPMKIRATMIAEPYEAGWIWTHWHASMREPFTTAMPLFTPPPPAAIVDP